jgi:hypothetical protein
MSEPCNPVVPYRWDGDLPPPLERALPLPVQPYIDPIYNAHSAD